MFGTNASFIVFIQAGEHHSIDHGKNRYFNYAYICIQLHLTVQQI